MSLPRESPAPDLPNDADENTSTSESGSSSSHAACATRGAWRPRLSRRARARPAAARGERTPLRSPSGGEEGRGPPTRAAHSREAARHRARYGQQQQRQRATTSAAAFAHTGTIIHLPFP